MSEVHRPSRPQWTCLVDGSAWPCRPAKQLLANGYAERDEMLLAHLARLLAIAASDLRVSDPARLYRRFVGWHPGSRGPCQRCGSPTHAYLANLPPRYTPCTQVTRRSPALDYGRSGGTPPCRRQG